MGCCCGIAYTRLTHSDYNLDEDDLICVGELDGHDFSKYYFDVRHMRLLCKYRNGYIVVGFLYLHDPRISNLYLLSNDKGQRIFYDIDTFKARMKNKYHQEMRNRIRNEIKNEQEGSKDLLLN